MMKFAIILLLAFVMHSPSPANAFCCYCTDQCLDGTPCTPYCGYGGCNLFGCNCGGGCRHAAFLLQGEPQGISLTRTASTFAAIDSNGDGAIDKDEARDYLEKQGTWNEIELEAMFENQWAKMDVSGDGKISPKEFDSDLSK